MAPARSAPSGTVLHVAMHNGVTLQTSNVGVAKFIVNRLTVDTTKKHTTQFFNIADEDTDYKAPASLRHKTLDAYFPVGYTDGPPSTPRCSLSSDEDTIEEGSSCMQGTHGSRRTQYAKKDDNQDNLSSGIFIQYAVNNAYPNTEDISDGSGFTQPAMDDEYRNSAVISHGCDLTESAVNDDSSNSTNPLYGDGFTKHAVQDKCPNTEDASPDTGDQLHGSSFTGPAMKDENQSSEDNYHGDHCHKHVVNDEYQDNSYGGNPESDMTYKRLGAEDNLHGCSFAKPTVSFTGQSMQADAGNSPEAYTTEDIETLHSPGTAAAIRTLPRTASPRCSTPQPAPPLSDHPRRPHDPGVCSDHCHHDQAEQVENCQRSLESTRAHTPLSHTGLNYHVQDTGDCGNQQVPYQVMPAHLSSRLYHLTRSLDAQGQSHHSDDMQQCMAAVIRQDWAALDRFISLIEAAIHAAPRSRRPRKRGNAAPCRTSV